MSDDSFEFEHCNYGLRLTRNWSRPAAWAALTWVTLRQGLDMSAIEIARAAAQMATFLHLPVVND